MVVLVEVSFFVCPKPYMYATLAQVWNLRFEQLPVCHFKRRYTEAELFTNDHTG